MFLQAFRIRRAGDAFFGDDSGDKFIGRDVEGVIANVDTFGCKLNILNVGDLADVSFFDRYLFAGRTVQVYGRERRSDVEGNSVAFCEHGDHIGADLVGNVAICGNAVTAHDHGLDAAFFHHVAAHVVSYKRDRNVVLQQFPGGKPCALEIGPGFVRDNRNMLALIDSSTDNAECGAPDAAGGESSGVAMREDCGVVFDQLAAEFCDQALIRCPLRGSLSRPAKGSA